MQAEAKTLEIAAETETFRATAAEICNMDRWVEKFGTHWGLPERTVFRARVCIAEIAANMLEHGLAHPASDQIVITLRNQTPALEIEMADTGKAFNPAKLPEIANTGLLQSITDGGRGLQLLHAYASTMAYRREWDKNILILRVSPR